ncbi:LuxR C-terminal-related transcriptional regulator [Nocardioides sp.]|uniref:LuxR C-terminal-related transcriptional regulator n=1 Tax=Nocardioides sp. TaxID=35761 RepID=UPI0031FE9D46|nr:ATP-dependent transcriptional regulator, MalT-like, LuxR family [Nocardioides sp.]
MTLSQDPLLETKLFAPPRRPGLVSRPRLMARLDRGLAARLMLVSAPAGFGKTTMLSEWLTPPVGDGLSPAWLSLDHHDDDPATFWAYVIAALRTASPGVGASSLALLQAARPTSVRALLTTLINELSAATQGVVLLLDDYHVIESPEIHEGIGFLVEHLPPTLHLVLIGRADPPLPLASLRARGDLVEIRATDLRFTADEAAAYLNGAMGLELTAEDVAALEARTEGWIAALQLAALSIEDRPDASGFIAGFAGDDRYVVDYLVDEVLTRQPPQVQDFLLQTSILERMNGPLCEALTGQQGGRATLESLDTKNLFLVPLDDRRRWYRYHHLFADVLQARLLDEHPEQLPVLHRAASEWLAGQGFSTEAIEHAMAGQDFSRAADLVEHELSVLRRDRREAPLRAWLERLPDDVLRVRPVLCNGLAGSRLSTGTMEGVEARLDDAQRWLDLSADDAVASGMVVVNDEEFRRLPAGVAIHRAGLALGQGDVTATITWARQALETALVDDHLARGAALALGGLAAWASGDLDVAQEAYAACLVEFEPIGHVSDMLGCSIALADIQLARGRLREARLTFDRGLQLASGQDGAVLRGTADMHVGLAGLHCELDDLASARERLTRSTDLGEHASLPQNPYRWRVALARISQAEGDLDAAVTLLDEATRVYVGDFSPDVRPVPAMLTRAWLAQDRLDEALDWVTRRGLSVTDDPSYLRECEHLTLARVLMAAHARDREAGFLDQALDLLQRLGDSAEAGRRSGSVIEIRATQAVAHHQQGDRPAALSALESALRLAEPEGYVRTFVEHGAPMETLLEAAVTQGITPRYARRLLTAFGAAPTPGGAADLVDPLSDREREVLRLLASELSGPEIARELVVSLNTVRSHTKSIYAKLGVSSRRTAVRRARELDLLSRT